MKIFANKVKLNVEYCRERREMYKNISVVAKKKTKKTKITKKNPKLILNQTIQKKKIICKFTQLKLILADCKQQQQSEY